MNKQLCFVMAQRYPQGWYSECWSTLSPEEDLSSHMQSPGWQPIYLVVWYLRQWFANKEKSMVMQDTKCPHCDQVSLNNTTSNFSSKKEDFVCVAILAQKTTSNSNIYCYTHLRLEDITSTQIYHNHTLLQCITVFYTRALFSPMIYTYYLHKDSRS